MQLKRLLCSGVLAGMVAYSPLTIAEPGVLPDKVLLGGSNALTGAVAAVCAPATYGAKAWFDKVNRDGGVHGRKIEYNVLDDAYSPQRAVANVRRLLQQDNVFGIFGGCATATSAAILQLLGSQPEVPYLFPWAGMNELTEPPKKAVFALLPNYVFQVNAALPFTIERASNRPRTAALLSMNVPGVEDMRKAARDVFSKYGIKVVYDEIFEVNIPDHTPFILQMKAQNPDIVLFSDSAAGAAKMFLSMKRQNWRPAVGFGVATLTAEQFLEPVGEFANDWLVAAGMVSPPTAPAARDCVDALKASYPDQKPNHFTMFGCLAAKIGVEGLQRAGRELTRDKLIAALEGLNNFETGISGPISFGPNQRMGTSAVVPFGVANGQFITVGKPLQPAR